MYYSSMLWFNVIDSIVLACIYHMLGCSLHSITQPTEDPKRRSRVAWLVSFAVTIPINICVQTLPISSVVDRLNDVLFSTAVLLVISYVFTFCMVLSKKLKISVKSDLIITTVMFLLELFAYCAVLADVL